MQVVYARCAGLDVHKKTVSACVSVCEAEGGKQQQMRVFGTFTSDLLALADWLQEQGVTHVAMEATGVYWRPVFHITAGQQVTTIRGSALDWIFVRGPLKFEKGLIHSDAKASDHFPLTAVIHLD